MILFHLNFFSVVTVDLLSSCKTACGDVTVSARGGEVRYNHERDRRGKIYFLTVLFTKLSWPIDWESLSENKQELVELFPTRCKL
jgi:hypothetical protein